MIAARGVALLVCCSLCGDARAQTMERETAEALPLANVFALLETTRAEVVADRFNSGGLNVGAPSRLGGFLSSWGQTRYRIGETDVGSAVDGTPLLFPSLTWWRAIEPHDGTLAGSGIVSGLSVALRPERPGAEWRGAIEVTGSGGALTAEGRAEGPPPIARLQRLGRARVLASGPLSDRVALALGGEWADHAIVERSALRRERSFGALFGHLVLTSAEDLELRTLVIAQRAAGSAVDVAPGPSADGSARDRPISGPTPAEPAIHLQTTIARGGKRALSWQVHAGYTHARRQPSFAGTPDEIERLVDGPVPAIVADRERAERQWSAGVTIEPPLAGNRHAIVLGGTVAGARVREPAFDAREIRERIDGVPVRLWRYPAITSDARRRTIEIAAFVRDRIAIAPTVALDTAVRVDHAEGRADGAAGDISWTSVLPSVALRWSLGTRAALTFFTGAQRTAHRLRLDLLAAGDPAAPHPAVYRWDAASDAAGPLVARVGPGSGGDLAVTAIDPGLRRPHTDEFVIGVESRPRTGMRFALSGIAARQSPAVQMVNTGVTASDYRSFTVPDANADLVDPDDDQALTIYERLPESFGRDRYLLTNPPLDAATMGALTISAEVATPRLFLSVSAAAAAAAGSGAFRGFRGFENDLDALGDVAADPNAATYARGRLFSDRAYVVKTAMVYRFAFDMSLGVIARYQDGQPFSRLVVVPGLQQGTEIVQAFPRGRSRFAFTGTLDVRLQKRFRLDRVNLDALVDVYNLANMRRETEERVVTGARFRDTTAVQPSPSAHLGLRLSF